MSWFIVNVPTREVDRAQLDGVTKGFCRVLVARGTDRIVGASIVFEHANKQISAVALAMTKWTWAQRVCAHTMHPYPTQGQLLRKAADAWTRRKLTPTVTTLFGWYFRTAG